MDAPTSAPYFISDELGNQLVSRMIMLGLDADAAKLRAWVRDRNRGHHAHRLVRPRRAAVGDDRAARARPGGADEGQGGREPRAAHASVPRDLQGDRRARSGGAAARSRVTPDGTRSKAHLSPSHRSISVYESTLEGMLGQLFTSMQLNYQVLLDEAIAELEGGKGTKGLEEAKKMIEERIKPLVFFRAGDFTPEDVLIDATRSTFGAGGGRLPRRLLAEVEGAQHRLHLLRRHCRRRATRSSWRSGASGATGTTRSSCSSASTGSARPTPRTPRSSSSSAACACTTTTTGGAS